MVTEVKVGSAITFLEDEAALRERVNGIRGKQVSDRSVEFCGYRGEGVCL